MKTKATVLAGLLSVIILLLVSTSAFAQTDAGDKTWAILVAKTVMGFSLSLGLAGSAVGLGITFSALLGGGRGKLFQEYCCSPHACYTGDIFHRLPVCQHGQH